MTIEVEVVDALAVSVTAVPIGRKYDGLTRTVSLDRTITLRPFIWNGTNPKFSWTIDGQEVGTEPFVHLYPDRNGNQKDRFHRNGYHRRTRNDPLEVHHAHQ